MVRHRSQALRLCGDRDLARPAGAWFSAGNGGSNGRSNRRRYLWTFGFVRTLRDRLVVAATDPTTPAALRRLRCAQSLACVMGDMDLLRPLALAGIPCAVVSRPGVPSLYSRYAQSRLAWNDYADNTDGLVDTLVRFGKAQARTAGTVLRGGRTDLVGFAASQAPGASVPLRRRRRDAGRRYARQGALPGVRGTSRPAGAGGAAFDPAAIEPAELGLAFPLIIKPLTRLDRWNDTFGLRKALCAENIEALQALWPRLHAVGLELLAQEFIPGTEARIENYHCYVDAHGRIAGEFTGRKIRTYPLSYRPHHRAGNHRCRRRAAPRPRHCANG